VQHCRCFLAEQSKSGCKHVRKCRATSEIWEQVCHAGNLRIINTQRSIWTLNG
jgi:hypothetical protein